MCAPPNQSKMCPALIQVLKTSSPDALQKGVGQVNDIAAAILFLLNQPPGVKLENISL